MVVTTGHVPKQPVVYRCEKDAEGFIRLPVQVQQALGLQAGHRVDLQVLGDRVQMSHAWPCCRLCGGSPPPWVERQVLAVLNSLIAHPEQLRCPPCENALPSEVIRLRQELDDLLNTPPVDEDRAREMALHLAELQLNAIGPEEYETTRLQRLFQKHRPMDDLDQGLLHESVRRITYNRRTVSILLKNNQIVEGGTPQ